MRLRGRIAAVSIILIVHTAYIFYYYHRDGTVDIGDLLGYPLLASIAYWAGLQYDRAVFFSEKDNLTNLYNRRYVTHIFDKLIVSATRSGTNLFVLILDCDNFKMINDTYNHHTGDTVLCHISQLLIRGTRKDDIVSRWGGDEFLVLGQLVHETDVHPVIDNIQSELLNLSNQMGFEVSVSIGMAIFSPDRHGDLSNLLKEADHNMYSAKISKKEKIQVTSSPY